MRAAVVVAERVGRPYTATLNQGEAPSSRLILVHGGVNFTSFCVVPALKCDIDVITSLAAVVVAERVGRPYTATLNQGEAPANSRVLRFAATAAATAAAAAAAASAEYTAQEISSTFENVFEQISTAAFQVRLGARLASNERGVRPLHRGTKGGHDSHREDDRSSGDTHDGTNV